MVSKMNGKGLKKKILIFGSIADFGGREVEVKNIISAISNTYQVRLFSTIPMTEKSMAIIGLDCSWTTLYRELYRYNFTIKLFSLFNKKWNKSKLPAYFLVSNKFNNYFFNLSKINKRILKNEIDLADVVMFCGVFTSGFLNYIGDYTLKLNKPFLFRTTGTIDSVPKEIKYLLPTISSILVHSNLNTNILKGITFNNIRIIDQTTLEEKRLLELPISKYTKLTFGYLGRFSNEKGIIELLKIFKKLNLNLVVAGNGSLVNEVNDLCQNNSHLENMGELQSCQIVDFFERIDVLVIPSFEESGPLVGIEAMAAGKLIISTKVGAMVERLDNTKNQFWFDISDEKSLLNVISEIENLDMDNVIAFREELRTLYKSKYSQKVLAENYLNVLESVF